MKEYYEGSLSYRDYVVHIFTGILFNIFLLAAIWKILPPYWWEHDLQNELIWSLVAIPVLFLEGHFLLAINRLILIEIPSWIFRLKNKKDSHPIEGECSDYENQELAFYRRWRENLYKKYKVLFYLFFGKRSMGQLDIKRDQDGVLVKTNKENKLIDASRYDILADFFTGVGCAAWIALFVAMCQANWCVVGCMFAIILLSWLRCRFFSWLYVKNTYSKKLP